MWPVLALALTTGATPVFTNKTPASPPTVRRSSDAALKPTPGEDQLFIYGGFNGATLSDFGMYKSAGNIWGAPLTMALPPRERHSMAYDPVHDLVVIVGGANGFSVFDTVTLINGTFTVSIPPLTTPRPTARIDASLHWVPSLGKFLYFGGQANVLGSNHFNDLWTLDVGDGGVNWQPVNTLATTLPLGRGAVCSAWDPDSDRFIFFGGEINGPTNSADLFTFAFDAGWSQQVTTGGPTARSFCAAEWEPNIKQLVIYGGQTTGPTGGLYSFDPKTRIWTTHTTPLNPGNLSDSAAAYSPHQKGILFFGGRSGASTYTNNTWLLRFNQPPVVSAGTNFSIPESAAASLSGSASDPEMDPLTSTWTQLMGPPVMLSGPALTPMFTAPVVTSDTALRFQLTANDGLQSRSSEVVVTVLNTINEAPIANAGVDVTVDGGTVVVLSGSGSDPNGTAVTFGWSQLAGPGVTLAAPMTAMPSFVAPNVPIATVLSFRLVVNDGMLASPPDDVFVSVNPDPYVDAGPPDAGPPDAGPPDAGPPDAGTPDAGEPDAGTPDAGPLDAGPPDAGELDAGPPDAGPPDAGEPDAGLPDAGSANDAGSLEPRNLGVGCACSQAPFSLWWAAGLALLLRRRR